jgi:hypothetical protein
MKLIIILLSIIYSNPLGKNIFKETNSSGIDSDSVMSKTNDPKQTNCYACETREKELQTGNCFQPDRDTIQTKCLGKCYTKKETFTISAYEGVPTKYKITRGCLNEVKMEEMRTECKDNPATRTCEIVKECASDLCNGHDLPGKLYQLTQWIVKNSISVITILVLLLTVRIWWVFKTQNDNTNKTVYTRIFCCFSRASLLNSEEKVNPC